MDATSRPGRPDGRSPDELRPIQIEVGFTSLPAGSVLARFGGTHVLCTVSAERGVPQFLQDSGRGWLTAEYRLLPGATRPRQPRELMKLSGRTQEIQRLIGRSLRAALDLAAMPNLTLTVDVDVLQADGGTRTAGISAGFVALRCAITRLLAEEALTVDPIQRAIAAVSVGLIDGEARLDLNYSEDAAASVDLNVVADEALHLIEVQGTAESGSYTRQQLNAMLDLAEAGIQRILEIQRYSVPS